MLRKLSSPIPSAEIDAKLGHVQSPGEISGCFKLDSLDEISEHFSSPPRKHLHIIVELPPTREYHRHLSISRTSLNDPPSCSLTLLLPWPNIILTAGFLF